MSIPTPEELKTYDVPDPAKEPGYVGRSLLVAILGIGLGVGLLKALELKHLVYVASHDDGHSYGGGIGYIQHDAMWELQEKFEPEALLPYIIEFEDPKARGFFHAALAKSGDPKQIDAVIAWLRSVEYSVGSDLEKAVPSMIALGKKEAGEKLVVSHETAEPSPRDSSFFTAVEKALREKWAPTDYVAPVLKIEDPVRRGLFHAALATTKDPKQVDAVLAYAKSVVPSDPGASRPDEWGPIVESLGAFGPAASAKLEAALEQTESRSLVSLAAEALRTSDLGFLIKRTKARLDEYDEAIPELIPAFRLARGVEDGEITDADPADVAEARKKVEAASAKAYMIFEMLRALDQVANDQQVDFCVVRGLSTFDRRIAEWSAQRIKARLSPEKLVDTLFSYMAQKSEFEVSEVDTYEGLIRELGGSGGKRVAVNLDRLLDEAKGDPGEVFWIYKKMGFALLNELGGKDAIPVLEKYASDGGGYTLTTTSTNSMGQKSREEVQKKYADQVAEAIKAINGRGGQPPSAPAPSTETTSDEGD